MYNEIRYCVFKFEIIIEIMFRIFGFCKYFENTLKVFFINIQKIDKQ